MRAVGDEMSAPDGARTSRRHGDEGSALILVLVMIVIGSLLASGIDHELRMTVTPALQAQVPQVVRAVARAGGHSLVLQRARADGTDSAFAAQLARVSDWEERFAQTADAAVRQGESIGVQVSSRS